MATDARIEEHDYRHAASAAIGRGCLRASRARDDFQCTNFDVMHHLDAFAPTGVAESAADAVMVPLEE